MDFSATAALCLLLLLSSPTLVFAQAPRDNASPVNVQDTRLAPVQPNSAIEQERARTVCDPNFRELNGVCTNPVFRLWGSTGRAQSSLFFNHSSRFPTGSSLPSARKISNDLCSQTMNMFNNRNLNEITTFVGQFIDHNLAATPQSSEQMNIPVAPDDPIFGNVTNGELKFFRSRRARVDVLGLFGSGSNRLASKVPSLISRNPSLAPNSQSIISTLSHLPSGGTGRFLRYLWPFQRKHNRNRPNKQVGAPASLIGPNVAPKASSFSSFFNNERPSNSPTSVLDLSAVYGVDENRNNALRTISSGKLKVTPSPQGDLLPLNLPELSNAPTSENIYFLAGDHRSNEHPVLTSLHTLFVREHNNICDELRTNFPTWTDDMLYKNARKINSAQFQKIVFEEYYPAMVGKSLGPYKGFKLFRNPNLIDVFSTAAFRVGHTMVGNVISRRGPFNSPLPSLPMSDMFFRVASTLNNGIEEFLRGALQVRAQEIDIKVHNALRDFLFTGIPEEGIALDLVALNIQRGRDHALPTFNAIRSRLGLSPALSFAGITSDVGLQSRLSSVYGTVSKVEAWIGMIAEDHAPGSSMGRTMNAVWKRQFTNLRDGDRFFFRNDIFPTELREAIPRINAMFTQTETLRAIILRNTAITAAELPPNIFFKN